MTKIVLDERGIQQLDREPGLLKHLMEQGRVMQIFATQFGAADATRTGHYIRALRYYPKRRPGLVVYVVANDFKSHWIEWGAGPSPRRGGESFPARNILWRAARATGLRLRRAPKGEA